MRIEFQISPNHALPSDFDAWHCVLNNCYLALDEDEDADWERRHPTDSRAARSPACQAEVEASWQRIFDLDVIRASQHWASYGEAYTQAVVAVIPMESVRRTHIFVAR